MERNTGSSQPAAQPKAGGNGLTKEEREKMQAEEEQAMRLQAEKAAQGKK
ncbi:hypothetical protein PMIN03_012246 [Paraphaeosphaeria minitans]